MALQPPLAYEAVSGNFVEHETESKNLWIPGVMSIEWVPSIGNAKYPTDPASIAAKEIYARVRAAYSGTLQADPPDFVIYLLALDSVFSYIASLKRIYRIITAYTPENYNTPTVLLNALGVGDAAATALRQNKMQFFQVINELIGMTRKFRCPAVFSLFNRHYWLNDNVYTDAASLNSQWYTFVQTMFYKFSMIKTPQDVPAGGLVYEMFNFNVDPANAVSNCFAFGRQLIDALASSEDAYTISGYLERAYDGYPVFTVDELMLDEKFTPVYEPEVLAQIENAHSLPAPFVLSNTLWPVSQDPTTNTLLCDVKLPNFSNNKMFLISKPFITIRSDAPTVPEIVEATRLKTWIEGNRTIHCGTEIVIRMYVNKFGDTLDTQTPTMLHYPCGDIIDPNNDSGFLAAGGLMGAMLFSQSFDWKPVTDVAFYSGPDNAFGAAFLAGDIHNITQVSVETLTNLHKVCLYSEFGSFGQI